MTKPKWIMIAEDDKLIAELTTLALAPDKLNCELVVAHDGLEALDCLHQHGGPPAFVLLDLKMPRMDGMEVLRQIKSDTRLKSIPVLIFSSSRETADVTRCYQLGANAYIVKPAGFDKFSEAIKQIGTFWAELNEFPPETDSVANAASRNPPVPDSRQMAGAV